MPAYTFGSKASEKMNKERAAPSRLGTAKKSEASPTKKHNYISSPRTPVVNPKPAVPS